MRASRSGVSTMQGHARSGIAVKTPACRSRSWCRIIGVETYFGRITGSYRVLDALATLAFRLSAALRQFFRGTQLQFLFMLAREEGNLRAQLTAN